MADIPVNAGDAIITVDVVTNGQNVFAFDFLTYSVEDIRAIYVTPGGMRVEIPQTTGFGVSGLENAAGGTIQLLGGAPVTEFGGKVIIYRDIEIKRLADYQTLGDFRASTVNREMDTVFMIMQEFQRDLNRALLVDLGQTPPDIPSILAASVAAVAAAAAAQAAAASVNIRQIATRAGVKALDTSATALVFLSEQGREGLFKWQAGDFSSRISADTAEALFLKANLVDATAGAWVRQFEGVQDIRWFGGVSGGSVDNAAAFLAAASVGGQVYVPEGTFLVTLTTANFDALARGLFIRCIGPGVIDAVVPVGFITAAAQFGTYNQETCRINIRGTNVSGNLAAANISITGSIGNYAAAITFPALPAGMAVGQLLSLATTDRTVPAVLLCGAMKITAIAGNVVTVALTYANGAWQAPPASLSFTGSYVNGQSVINYTQFRTLFAVVADGVKLSLSRLAMIGPYVVSPLAGVNTVAFSLGIKDQTEELCSSTQKLSDCLISGFNYGILQHGGSLNIQRPHIGGCSQGARFVRGAQAFMTNVRIGGNADSGVHIDALSKVVHEGEGMSCGNGGRGVWSFTGGWFSSGAFETSYNGSAGIYGKNGAVIFEAPNSRARFNNDIGFGNENSFLNVISTFSLDNRKTGYEIGAGGFTDLTNSVSLRNEQAVYALLSAGAECANVDAGYSVGGPGISGNGMAAGEGSTIRAKNSRSHHNTGDGYTAVGNSHIRNDGATADSNTGYGERALINSSIRNPGGVFTPANTAGATNSDATSVVV